MTDGLPPLRSECGVACSRCRCCLPDGHETPHVCRCGGSYDYRGEDGKELHVYALPPGHTGIYVEDDVALVLANRYAQSKPILIEDRPDDRPNGVPPLRVSRRPIRFFRVPPVEDVQL